MMMRLTPSLNRFEAIAVLCAPKEHPVYFANHYIHRERSSANLINNFMHACMHALSPAGDGARKGSVHGRTGSRKRGTAPLR